MLASGFATAAIPGLATAAVSDLALEAPRLSKSSSVVTFATAAVSDLALEAQAFHQAEDSTADSRHSRPRQYEHRDSHEYQ